RSASGAVCSPALPPWTCCRAAPGAVPYPVPRRTGCRAVLLCCACPWADTVRRAGLSVEWSGAPWSWTCPATGAVVREFLRVDLTRSGGGLDRRVDAGPRLLPDPADPVLGQPALLPQRLLVGGQRITADARPALGSRLEQAHGVHLDEGRAAALAGALDRRPRVLVHALHRVVLNACGGEAVGGPRRSDARSDSRPRFPVPVGVLDDEHHRQRPQHREAERLPEAFVARRLRVGHRDRDQAGALLLEPERTAERERVGLGGRGRAHEVGVRVVEVPAFPTAAPARGR